MELIKVNSSNITSVGYDPSTKVMIIQFHKGGYYKYDAIEESMYKNMMSSSSVGSYFHAYIKGKFNYSKIDVNTQELINVTPTNLLDQPGN